MPLTRYKRKWIIACAVLFGILLPLYQITIAGRALPPLLLFHTSKFTILAIDMLITVALGIIAAFILKRPNTTLRSVREIEKTSDLPLLAVVPRMRHGSAALSELGVTEREITSLSSQRSQFVEAFHALHTSLLHRAAGPLPKVILLTSTAPSEGKTTVSVNFASVLAQGGLRVLLIDADLRRPSIHHRLGLNGRVGLSCVLSDTSTLEQALQRLPKLPTLDILVSGPVPPLPAELLSSISMTGLLRRCRGLYTHIVIDSPPVLHAPDGIVLASHADAVVLVLRHGRSKRSALRRAQDLLVRSGAPIAGLVLNAFN